MLIVRPNHKRGLTQTKWLDSWHTFSFADYYDAKHTHFRSLRVLNQDIIQPQQGFNFHSHYDMEIITYVLRGALAHRDSLGNEGTIHAGEVQRITAGTGIMHSEFNASKKHVVELLQIWILPAQKQLPPSYEQKNFPRLGPLQLLVSPTGEENSAIINQDVKIYRGILKAKRSLTYPNFTNRHFWLQQISGQLQIDETTIYPGDGVAMEGQLNFMFTALTDSEFLLFDLG